MTRKKSAQEFQGRRNGALHVACETPHGGIKQEEKGGKKLVKKFGERQKEMSQR